MPSHGEIENNAPYKDVSIYVGTYIIISLYKPYLNVNILIHLPIYKCT